MTGEVEIDGRFVQWEMVAGLVKFGGSFAFLMHGGPNGPSVEEIEAALRGWHRGYAEGKHVGRSILQNEFRNLMGCQK